MLNDQRDYYKHGVQAFILCDSKINIELSFTPGDIGEGGRLRCIHGKVYTPLFQVSMCTIGSTRCYGLVYDPSIMATSTSGKIISPK